MKQKYDEITEVNKNIDELEHIEKFNPFHDSRGRFSSSQGMKSYSANPKTKAGQMAIQRSTAAGYGAVFNVHRESKGENLRQNDNWIRTGVKPNKSQLARAQANAPKTVQQMQRNAHTNRVKGTMGATDKSPAKHPARTNTTKPNQQNQQQQANQPKQQQNQTASTALASQVSDVQLASSHKLAIVPRNRAGQPINAQKICNDHDQAHVKGQDISKSFDASKVKGTSAAIDKVSAAQGWNKQPTVTNDLDVFQKAAVKHGQIYIRTVKPNSHTGESEDDICKKTMTDPNSSLNGTGMQAFGGGLYTVGSAIGNTRGPALGRKIAASQYESAGYGTKQMMSTLSPNAKVASPTKARSLNNEFSSLSMSQRRKFGNDIGAYIASKGYDAAQWHTDNTPYVTIYNKSALIFYGGVAQL